MNYTPEQYESQRIHPELPPSVSSRIEVLSRAYLNSQELLKDADSARVHPQQVAHHQETRRQSVTATDIARNRIKRIHQSHDK